MNKRAVLIPLLSFQLAAATAVLLGHGMEDKAAAALPDGLFAAAALVTLYGLGSQFWLHVLPLSGKTPPPAFLARAADAGLWCGWLTMGLCLVPLGFLPSSAATATPPYLHPAFPCTILGGAAAQLLCRTCHATGKRWLRLPAALLCAATALLCGLQWWQGYAASFLATAAALPLSLFLFLPRTTPLPPYIRLYFTAAALTLYTLYFHSLIRRYPPLPQESVAEGLLPAALPMAGSLLLLLLPAGRQSRLGLRLTGGLGALSCLLLNREMAGLPLTASGIAYLASLAGLTVLAARCQQVPAPPGKRA